MHRSGKQHALCDDDKGGMCTLISKKMIYDNIFDAVKDKVCSIEQALLSLLVEYKTF
jgi:hypothetical protein